MSSYCVWLLSLTSSTSIYRVLSGPMPFVPVFQDAFVDTKPTLAFTGVAVSSLAVTSRLVYAFG
jgi:hypothetical protein